MRAIRVAEGEVVVIIEAMKMMNEIRAHKAGLVSAIHAVGGHNGRGADPAHHAGLTGVDVRNETAAR